MSFVKANKMEKVQTVLAPTVEGILSLRKEKDHGEKAVAMEQSSWISEIP